MTENIKTSATAIWSLVLGILGFCLCLFGGFIPAIPAVVCGHIALNSIKSSAGQLGGRGMALAGLILGYLCIGVAFIGLVAALVIPAFAKGRGESQRSACQNGQRLVSNAVDEWALSANINEGAATDPAAVVTFLKNNELPKCPTRGLPIAIPEKFGDKVVCPDLNVTDEHTLP